MFLMLKIKSNLVIIIQRLFYLILINLLHLKRFLYLPSDKKTAVKIKF